MEMSRAKWTDGHLTSEKCESLPLMCLKYNAGSLKTQSNDANYHMLAKILKLSPIKMQYAHDNQEDFT